MTAGDRPQEPPLRDVGHHRKLFTILAAKNAHDHVQVLVRRHHRHVISCEVRGDHEIAEGGGFQECAAHLGAADHATEHTVVVDDVEVVGGFRGHPVDDLPQMGLGSDHRGLFVHGAAYSKRTQYVDLATSKDVDAPP